MGPEAKLLEQAVKECPDWLKPRIATLASNLCMLHRIQHAPVSEKTTRQMLVAMGFLLTKIIFDYAKAGQAELEAKLARDFLEANPEMLEQVRAVCPHSEFVRDNGEGSLMVCSSCGLPWDEKIMKRDALGLRVVADPDMPNLKPDPDAGCHGIGSDPQPEGESNGQNQK